MVTKTVVLLCRQRNSLFVPAPGLKDDGESENNILYHWTDELEVRQIVEISESLDGIYNLEGESETLGKFNFPIKGLRTIRMVDLNGNQTFFAFSNALISAFSKQEDLDSITYTVELLDTEPFGNPIPGIYLVLSDFPDELK